MDLYQVCSNGGPGVEMALRRGGGGGGGGGLGLKNEKYTSKSSSPELLGSGA